LDTRFALPVNTVLDGTYKIVRVVGLGGFGITYEAFDVKLATRVALKEYYPCDFGDRDRTMSVRPRSERHRKTFEWGRSNFLKEARTLARFEHPSIVRVSRVFEANSTAYMVMSFEEGQSFEHWLTNLGRPPAQEELDGIVAPMLAALEMMHAADFLHRDIAPDNIIVRADGSPVLLDFGAARRAVAEMSRTMTGIVKAGYSPHEQYSADSRLQGPWSDLYALGGTLYRAVTGSPPEEATLRVDEDRLAPATLAARGSYRPGFLAAIDACLKVKQSDRPRSVAQLRPMLFEPAPRPQVRSQRVAPTSKLQSGPPRSLRVARPAPQSPARRWAVAVAATLMIAGGAYGGYQFTHWQQGRPSGSSGSTRGGEASKAEDADKLRQQARRDAERRRQEEDAAARAAAERREQEERAAAEAEARRKAEAEAEERKAAEQRRTASRDDGKGSGTGPPQGRMLTLSTKLGSQPNDAHRGWLGVGLEPLELPLALSLGLGNADGAVILSAMPASPAAQIGLRFGDIIVGLNGLRIPSMTELLSRLSSLAPGSEANLEVWRVGESDGDFLQAMLRLADGGNAYIMYRVGRMYALGLGAARSAGEAARWYRKGADAGNINAVAALAVALLEGNGTPVDTQEGLRLLRSAAAKDHVEAMNRLGHILLNGKIADKDALEAARLFTRAADAGHVPSMVDIGRMYGNGTGVQADASKAAMWFKRAADLGNSSGMAGLGWLYEHGKGVTQDLGQAVALYRRAIDLGNPAAMTDLALLHVQGKGVEKSEPTAVALYRKAAGLGNSIAMNNLAWMIQSGRGVARKDPAEAADLMLKALARHNEFSYRQMTQSWRAWSKEFRVALQTKLREAGFYSGQVDGEFRNTTTAAINAYINRTGTP